MTTNQRSILHQRAIRAEHARNVAEAENKQLRAALHDAQNAIRRLNHAAVLAAALNPVTRDPHTGDTVQLVLVRDAQFTSAGYHCPYTGEQLTPTKNTYWRKLEDPS